MTVITTLAQFSVGGFFLVRSIAFYALLRADTQLFGYLSYASVACAGLFFAPFFVCLAASFEKNIDLLQHIGISVSYIFSAIGFAFFCSSNAIEGVIFKSTDWVTFLGYTLAEVCMYGFLLSIAGKSLTIDVLFSQASLVSDLNINNLMSNSGKTLNTNAPNVKPIASNQ
jgi:hypothetical protein